MSDDAANEDEGLEAVAATVLDAVAEGQQLIRDLQGDSKKFSRLRQALATKSKY